MREITQHYINGRFVESHGTETMEIVSPTDGTLIGRVTLGDEEDARRAIQAAKEALNTYSKSSLEERSGYLQRIHDAILARTDENIAIRTLEYGGVARHNKFSIAGSTAVGKTIMRNAAQTIKRLTLELGGKSAHIILDDADLEKAIPFALSAVFMNSGQACIAGSRLLVPERRFEEVKAALLHGIDNWKVGDPSDDDTIIGPLVSKKQFERVQGYIRKGIEEGAQVLVGGEGKPEGLEHGNFVKPTIFVNVTNDMTIAREEIFGPVLSVITYKTEDEAIRIANDSPYGLQGWISTADPDRTGAGQSPSASKPACS
jgi:acyl-CoA reductase-like NAD-dependent aldehyde dehydrogenase